MVVDATPNEEAANQVAAVAATRIPRTIIVILPRKMEQIPLEEEVAELHRPCRLRELNTYDLVDGPDPHSPEEGSSNFYKPKRTTIG